MSENESASIEQPAEVVLAPMLAKFRSDLQASRKKLLKEKVHNKPVFGDPDQLRQFIAQYLYPQMVTMVEIFGPALNDTYAFAASNAEDIHRLRRLVRDELGHDGGDDGGATMETVNAIVAAMHVLGAMLQKKAPEDKELMETYSNVSKCIDQLLEEMTSSGDDDDDDYDDGDDDDYDDGDDDDDEPASESPAVKPTEASADKQPDDKPSV